VSAKAQGWPGGENPGRAMDEAVGGHVFSDYWEQQRRGRDEQRLRALEERENRRNAQPEREQDTSPHVQPTPRGVWDVPN
jgi:hypothetical protein